MAVPTLDELHKYVEELIAGRQPEDKFYVFEWEYLVQTSRRHFKTTSPVITSRMKQLLEEGRLAKVRISSGGHVYLVRDNAAVFGTLYFQYTGYREDYGYVTATRIPDMKNVWRADYRNLFTTAAQHERLTEHFLKLQDERSARAKAKEASETARLWEMLEAASPGARQVLDSLYEVLADGGKPRPEVRAQLWARSDKEDPYVEIEARNLEQSVKLIDIIRRGLPDKPVIT